MTLLTSRTTFANPARRSTSMIGSWPGDNCLRELPSPQTCTRNMTGSQPLRWEDFQAKRAHGLPDVNYSGLPVVFAGVGSQAFAGSTMKRAVGTQGPFSGFTNSSCDGGPPGTDGQHRLACIMVMERRSDGTPAVRSL
eukprot:Hpha_TRINITY_DN5865_c0_g1::TRINITY_DN5865_c0_g1_i2::g.45508::m.45508